MMRALKARYEKLLFGLAGMAVASSGTWLWQQQGRILGLRAEPVAVRLAGSRHEPASPRLPATQAAAWPKPTSQSPGPGWLYEIFTPPVIYYDASARSFTVTPPPSQNETGPPFGLELLAVRPEQFRLQLVGYFGAPGDYLVAFISPHRPETLLARAGRHFEGLGLTLRSFAVEKVLVEAGDTRPVYDVAGLAVLTDDRTGGEVMLDSRVRKFTDTPLAVLQPQTGGQSREVREGETFSDENSTYRIERIQLDPPEVVVARTTPGLPQSETRVLHPAAKAGGVAGKPAKTKSFSDRPAGTLATNGK